MKSYLKQKQEEKSIEQENKKIKRRMRQGAKLQKKEMEMPEKLKGTYAKQ